MSIVWQESTTSSTIASGRRTMTYIGSHSEGLPSLPIELLQAQYRKFWKLKNEDNFRVIPRDLISRGSY